MVTFWYWDRGFLFILLAGSGIFLFLGGGSLGGRTFLLEFLFLLADCGLCI